MSKDAVILITERRAAHESRLVEVEALLSEKRDLITSLAAEVAELQKYASLLAAAVQIGPDYEAAARDEESIIKPPISVAPRDDEEAIKDPVAKG